MRRDSYDIAYNPWWPTVRNAAFWLLSIVGIYLLSRFLTGFVMRFDPYFIYVAAVAIVVAVVVSQRLEMAIFVYALLAPLLIGASPGYTGTRSGYQPFVLPSQVGLVLLSAVWFTSAFFKRKPIAVRSSLYLPFAAFLFVCALSVASSYIIWDYSIPVTERRIKNQVVEVALFALCGMAFWLTHSSIQRKEWIKRLFWPVFLVGIYNAFINVSQIEPPIRLSRGDFITAFTDIMVLSRLLFAKDSRSMRVFLWTAFVFLLIGTYINLDWVSGWVTATLGMGLVVAFKSKKVFFWLALVVLFALFVYPGIYHIVYHESRAQGDMDRIDLWKDSINMANTVNPVLGIGPSDYLPYAFKYGSVWYGETTYTSPHSSFAQMIAEVGYLGFVMFLWIIFAGIRIGLRCVRRIDDSSKWFAIGAAVIFVSISISSLVGDYLLPSRTNGGLVSFGSSVLVWLLLGAASAAVRLTDKEPIREDDAKEEIEQVMAG